MANLYFLILGIMELFPSITDSGGKPVVWYSLALVIGISMIKDIYEDFNRHQSDKEENNRKTLVSKSYKVDKNDQIIYDSVEKSQFEDMSWKDIRVGQIVKVKENESFPCDMIILNSSLPKGMFYVETKSLDGETNLKLKLADKNCIKLSSDDREVLKNFSHASIESEK